MTTRIIAAAAVAFTTAACGGDHMGRSGPTEFAILASDISTKAQEHRVNVERAGDTGCATEMSRYVDEMGPLVDRMSSISADMDACMAAMGHAASADMQSTCAQMRDELDTHVGGGCAAADPLAETVRHADALGQMANHEMDRAASMGGMMGGRANMMSGRCSQ